MRYRKKKENYKKIFYFLRWKKKIKEKMKDFKLCLVIIS
jgi:hypothetical protein